MFLTYLRLDPSERADDPATPRKYGELRARTANHVVDDIRAAGGRADSFEADLRDTAVASDVFDRAERAFGPVEILVNNADASSCDTFKSEATDRFGRRLEPVGARSWDFHFGVNARAVALLIAEFARRHRERGASWGRIISITSSGRDGFPEEVSYGASKAALESYTYSAAWELARLGVTSNVVCPAATDTGWINASAAEAIRQASLFGRIGEPPDVADVVVFLASEQARYVTGQRIALS